MGGKEGSRLQYIEDMFGHRACNREAVVRTRPASDLIHDDQAVSGRVSKDVRGLVHLHEKRGLAACKVVRGADPAEDAVGEPDLRIIGRNEATGLGEEHDEGGLAQEGRLPGHVRPRDERESLRIAVELERVRHEASGRQMGFHDGMPSAANRNGVRLRNPRAHVAIPCRGPGKGVMAVERGNGVTDRKQSRNLRFHRRTKLEKEATLELDDLIGGRVEP